MFEKPAYFYQLCNYRVWKKNLAPSLNFSNGRIWFAATVPPTACWMEFLCSKESSVNLDSICFACEPDKYRKVTSLFVVGPLTNATYSRQASTLKTGINSGLTHFFFGPDAEGILTVDKFLQFQRHLQASFFCAMCHTPISVCKNLIEKAFFI